MAQTIPTDSPTSTLTQVLALGVLALAFLLGIIGSPWLPIGLVAAGVAFAVVLPGRGIVRYGGAFLLALMLISISVALSPTPIWSAPWSARADDGGVTRAQFEALTTGMSYAEAVSLLGGPGTELSRSALSGTDTVMYAWRGVGTAGANMNALFQNDRLVQKAQAGLR